MKAIRSCAVLGVAAFVFATACSSGSAGSSCGAYYDKLVAFLTQCGSGTTINTSQRDAFIAYCNELATAPGVTNLGGQLDACAATLDPSTCATPTCTIRGTLPASTGCATSVQCQSGDCLVVGSTDPTTELKCGTCEALATQGGDCTNAVCDTGLYCDSTTKKCTPKVTQGASCTSLTQCATGLYCDSQSKTCLSTPTKGQPCTTTCAAQYACISGTCADRVGAGGSCPSGNECQSSLTCNPQTHVCETLPAANAGEPCGFVNNQYVVCGSGLVCASGTCAAPKQQGAPCTVGNQECAINLVCSGGTCQVPDFGTCK
ncbi:MAG TPA: hypothetical protein VLM85_01255 [Polyangiaceae bacterium]|nr:hypothetical protein [Polyangiaceae bacterium]